MSLNTWKEEFYPVDALDIDNNSTDQELLQHALRKWNGLLPDNLSKHGVSIDSKYGVIDPRVSFQEYGVDNLPLSGISCALCMNRSCRVDESDEWSGDEPVCPLETHGYNCNFNCSPYDLFKEWDAVNDDYTFHPEPMIAALEKVLEIFQEESQK